MKTGLWVVKICIPEEANPAGPRWSQLLSLSVQQPGMSCDKIQGRVWEREVTGLLDLDNGG